ncbi:precorrin-3B synthase [Tabrizicola sp.]|uniref:precorrin-3B synthase n=1 Tax=Tabrizicola sp. TaxID=2005166 RepID=UPI00286AA7CA|nr:precorrin-3B synthase [Tabrizicola sp.]
MSAPEIKSHEIKGPQIKGWCPGALRPMQSGDGWLVRIRPPGGMLTPAQAAGIAKASLAHGNGILDLSSRANLQLRGVRPEAHAALIDDLSALGLIDPDIATETARNIVVTPFWQPGDGTQPLASRFAAALAAAPPLPGKFGFAIDTGPNPVLHDTPADIRLERDMSGQLILRPDGHALGKAVTEGTAIDAALALTRWFLATGGAPEGRGRMAAHLARADLPDGFALAAAPPLPLPLPGAVPQGALVAFAFGQMQAATLAGLAALGRDLRLTPWRMLLIAGADIAPDLPDLITTPDDPLLRVTACTGAPGCPQALGPTRDLARMLAPFVNHSLHVSGCAKGCAHPGLAPITLVATSSGYNLIRNGTASGAPHLTDLPPHLIAAALKDPNAASL